MCGSINIHNFVIARKERSEGRGNPSCLGGGGRVSLLPYWFTVDRHGLSALAMTRLERNGSVRFGYNTIFVIAKKERREGRDNPSCFEARVRLASSLAGSQWIATG